MIVRQFINWVRTAPAGERAEATRALARAWLISDLSEDDRAAAEGALLMLLDDASPLVRQAMAEVFARTSDAPPSIIAALSVDQPAIAISILEHSPLLIDADLVDIVATGNCETQCAIARRTDLPPSVSAAIAEVGSASSALELVENPDVALAPISLDRIVERHGHLAAIREALLALDDLPAPTRLALAERLSSTLAHFVTARQWLNPDRAHRVTSEALARSTVNVAAKSRGDDMIALIRHLRGTGQLTAGIVLRALLSGNLDLFEEALVELSGLSRNRVAALIHDRSAVSVSALLEKAGLPKSTYPAFRAALDASHEIGFVGTVDGATRLRRRMVERVLTQCEQGTSRAEESLLVLLRRFATESAREEARLYCDELVAEANYPTYNDDEDYPAEELVIAEPLDDVEPYEAELDVLELQSDEEEDIAQVEADIVWDKRLEPVFDDYASFDGHARQDNDDHSIAA